jgi:serine phosphatase RsbU (regulator of sigma subunit)
MMPLALDLATAKTNKYASRESGDTVEFIERPNGGFSAVMVDGQGSGAAAKSLSLQLTSRAVSLLKDGVRDGVVARAVHDSLFAYRGGKVSATVDIVSADLKTRQVLVTRNSPTPLLVGENGVVSRLESVSKPVGLYHFTRPAIHHFPLESGLLVVSYTDGVHSAGSRVRAGGFDALGELESLWPAHSTAHDMAQAILQRAIERDDGRPADDMAVIVLRVTEHQEEPIVRTISMRFPLP